MPKLFLPIGRAVLSLALPLCCGGGEAALAQGLSLVRTLHGHTNEVGAVAFSPDGKTLASGSSEYEAMDGTSGEVKLWDARTGRLRHTLDDRWYAAVSIAFSPDGRTLASGNVDEDDADEEVCLWDVAAGTLRRRLKGAGPVSFSPDGRLLATAGEITQKEGGGEYLPILLRSALTGQRLRTLRPRGLLDSLAFSPDGKTLVSSSNEETGDSTMGRVQLWDVPAGKLRRTFVNAGASSIIYSPDGLLRASISGNSDVRKAFVVTITDARTGRVHQTLRHRQNVYAVAFSPDSRTLITGSGSDIDVRDPSLTGHLDFWDVRTGRLKVQRRMSAPVLSVAVSPDGTRLATGMGDDTVKLWRLTVTRK